MPSESEADRRRLTIARALLRDEMRRTVTWRDRLDRTSNWAVVLTATLLTWSFSRPENPHFVILVASIGVLCFLLMEASRYRRYDVWRSRVRVLERDILAPELDEGLERRPDAWQMLAADLAEPSYKIPFTEALQRRLRRVYASLLLLLVLAWTLKVTTKVDGDSFVEACRIALIPGGVVLAGVVLYVLALVLFIAWPLKHSAMGRMSDRAIEDGDWEEHRNAGSEGRAP